MACPRIHAVLTTSTGPEAASALHRLAQRMAAQIQGAVGLIRVSGEAGGGGVLSVERIEARHPARFIPGSFHSPQSPPDVQLARILFSLRNLVECWLIMVPPLADPSSAAADPTGEIRRCLLASAPERILLTTPGREDILGAYRLLKDLSAQEEIETPQIKVLIDGPAHAMAFERLALTARNFLKLDLTRLDLPRATPDMLDAVAAAAAGGGTAGVEAVIQFDLAALSDAGRHALWLSVTDMVEELTGAAALDESEDESGEPADNAIPNPQSFDDLMDVLEPEERAALAAEWPERSAPENPPVVPTNGGQVLQKPILEKLPDPELADVAPTKVAPPLIPTPPIVSSAPIPVPTTAPANVLRAVDCPAFPTHSDALWPLVRDSIAGLMGGHTVLEAQPPSPHSLLSTDAAGKLHLWVLAEAADPVSWATLWQWARQNRQLISLTRRPCAQVTTQVTTGGVDVHIILAPVASTASGSTQPGLVIRGGGGAALEPSTAEAGAIHYYRTLPVTWSSRTGLVVIPA